MIPTRRFLSTRASLDLATNTKAALLLPVAICALLAAGCSGQSTGAKTTNAAATAAADTGVQTVTGTSPAAQGNFPTIIVLEPIGGGPQPPQAAPPRMDQEQQTFIPSILLVRTGEPVDFLNHDDVLHNVRVRNEETKESAFNVAIPTGEKYTHTFQRDGFYDVGCDIHPGMSAQIMSTSSPYSTLADPSGTFTIPDVPNGPYKAVAYFGADTIEKEINIAASSTTVDLRKP